MTGCSSLQLIALLRPCQDYALVFLPPSFSLQYPGLGSTQLGATKVLSHGDKTCIEEE